MIKCLMLALTLTLITLSAAYLGRDEQIRQVLQQTTKVAVKISSSEPAPHTPAAFVEFEQQLPSSEPEQPPRFIADEPIAPEPSSGSSIALPPAVEALDPSAETRLYPIESEPEDYTPTPPTEEQKLAAAEPFVKELFELTEQSSAELKNIINDAVYDYLSAAPDQRSQYMDKLVEKYTPAVLELESATDSKAEAVLLKMSAALMAIGADDGLVNDARAAYEYSKQQQAEHYAELLSSFSIEQ